MTSTGACRHRATCNGVLLVLGLFNNGARGFANTNKPMTLALAYVAAQMRWIKYSLLVVRVGGGGGGVTGDFFLATCTGGVDGGGAVVVVVVVVVVCKVNKREPKVRCRRNRDNKIR